jgi:hypothetical protein
VHEELRLPEDASPSDFSFFWMSVLPVQSFDDTVQAVFDDDPEDQHLIPHRSKSEIAYAVSEGTLTPSL